MNGSLEIQLANSKRTGGWQQRPSWGSAAAACKAYDPTKVPEQLLSRSK